ncbi:hypothetical protein CHS0354_020654 [Potamilus streckersoni]|uniref:Uncharacterized protein n=1 Tax=Potamilus streckersoni TaxID=2493646 RepID=A0AAE0T2U0_9BIVA|nr:hypothetical protein CHS0354_020654 [Potamilus streckersoni]
MRDLTAFLFLACVVKYATGLLRSDFQDNGINPQENYAGYCYDSRNQPVSVGQQYRLVCHICICGPYGRPIYCSDNLCNQQRPRTVSGASVNRPVKIPNKASVPFKIPLNPHVALKTPPQAKILPNPPQERLAAKPLANLFKQVEPSIAAVAAAKGKPPKRSKYA